MLLDKMLSEGFSRRQAEYLLKLFEDETHCDYYSQDYVEWSHSKGFSADSAYAYGLNPDNVNYYLSDYDYYKLYPHNNWPRIWINDKLTLKYILSKTEFDDFMPKYYFYSIKTGREIGIRKLVDCPDYIEQSCEGVVKLLQEVKVLACKPCNGALSLGFNKLSYEDDTYFINDKEVRSTNIATFVLNHPNYLFTEYLVPSESMRQVYPDIHTLRMVVINENGMNPKLIGGYLRFPHKTSGFGNYIVVSGTRHDDYNINLDVNMDSGEYGNAKLTFSNRTESASVHPETKASLIGKIEKYDELKSIILSISKKLSPLEFLGFDIGITPNGFKCMEINSLPGIKYMQLFKPFYHDPEISHYFSKKLHEIDSLSEMEKKERNNIVR